MCSTPVQKKKESNFNLSDPISMKKRHDNVSIAIFLLAQTFIKIYFTELYHMSFFKLLYFEENEDGSWILMAFFVCLNEMRFFFFGMHCLV